MILNPRCDLRQEEGLRSLTMPESHEDGDFEVEFQVANRPWSPQDVIVSLRQSVFPLQGMYGWKNIPSVVQQAFVNLSNKVKTQSRAIEKLEDQQRNCVHREEFLSAFSSKVSLQEYAFQASKVRSLFSSSAYCQPDSVSGCAYSSRSS